MRHINIIGLVLYVYVGIVYDSHIAYLVAINGFIFHMNETNMYLKYYDLGTNIVLLLFALYRCPQMFPCLTIGSISFVCNAYNLRHRAYSRIVGDIFHVVLSQHLIGIHAVHYFYDTRVCTVR